jgi:peptide/nickel transport system substrate-binding protein
MQCPKCNSQVPAGSSFCNKCGHDLRSLTAAQPVPAVTPAGARPRKGACLWFVGGVVLLMILGLVAGLVMGWLNTGQPQQVVVETEQVIVVVTNTPSGVSTEVALPVQTTRTSAPPPTARPTDTPQPLPTATRAVPKVLTVALAAEPDSLYVYSSAIDASRHVMQAFMDGPIDTLGYEYQPVILEKIPRVEDGDAVLQRVTVSAGESYCRGDSVETASKQMELDQLVVTFKLKEGLLWEDGTPLTAHDSTFGWQVFCDENTPNTDPYLCERTASYRATDDRTAVWTGLPGCLSPSYLANFATPLPEHVLGSQVAARGAASILNSDYERQPLGWGPFKVAEWLPGQYIHLVRNENYFRAAEGLPRLDEVYFTFPGDPALVLDQVASGQADVATSDSLLRSIYDEGYFDQLDAVVQAGQQGRVQLYAVPYNLWEHIDFSFQPLDGRPVFFDDLRVRQAVAYGTDRQAMIEQATDGLGQILDTLTPPGHPLYPPADMVTVYDYDPDQARHLLDDAGWLLGADGYRYKGGQKFSVTLYTTQAKFRERLVQVFVQNMADLGIEVVPQYVSLNDLVASTADAPLAGRRFDLAEFGWLVDLDPACELYLSSAIPNQANNWEGYNHTGYANPDYDAACNTALATLTAERAPYFYTAQQIFSQELPVFPLFQRALLAVTRPRVQNFALDPTADSDLWNVEVWDLIQ